MGGESEIEDEDEVRNAAGGSEIEDEDEVRNAAGGSEIEDEDEDEVVEKIKTDTNFITEEKIALGDYADEMEKLKEKHSPYAAGLKQVYDIVINYVVKNQRILTGGMAIDYALKLKGSYLYATDKIDYDFYSPQSHIDAYNITDEIAKICALNETHTIGARHISTMRVRYKYNVVADASYVPQNIFDKIPTLLYEGIKIVHPCYQIIDQHISMSKPYENAPMETIASDRWQKDLVRMMMFYDTYDIKEEMSKLAKNEPTKWTPIHVPIHADTCLFGYSAFCYWMNKSQPKKYMFNIKKDLIEMSHPPVPIMYLSDEFLDLADKITVDKQTYHNAFLDKMPRMVSVDGKYEVYDCFGMMIAAEEVDGIWVAGVQATLALLLTRALFYDDPDASTCYFELFDVFKGSFDKTDPTFVTSASAYGKHNLPTTDILGIIKTCMDFKPDVKPNTKTAQNYYPKPTKKPDYEFNLSEAFPIDGAETKRFTEVAIPSACLTAK